jgi:hypothetical protein
MTGGLSPPYGVVVQGWQVIMNERVRMDHFKSAGGRQRFICITCHRRRCGHAQGRAQAFATGHDGIFHGREKMIGWAESSNGIQYPSIDAFFLICDIAS